MKSRPQLKAMFLPLNNDMEVKYTLVHINNQFKIVGTFTSSGHISTFTLDLQQNIPRQFIYEDLHNIIKYMKHSFQDFLATSPQIYHTLLSPHTQYYILLPETRFTTGFWKHLHKYNNPILTLLISWYLNQPHNQSHKT